MPPFKKYKLEDAIELIKDGYTPSSDEHLHYIGLEHIEQQTLRLAGLGKTSDVTSNKFRFKTGDVLFGKLRPYFRKVYRPKFDGVCSTDIWVARAKKNFDQGFIFYVMATEEFIDLSSQGSSGTRMPRADWNNLKNIEWEFPDKSAQTQIASILSSLDDKIELNRRTNHTLEQIAQTLFKKYFVDDIDLENLPEGWELRSVYDVAEFVNGAAFKNKDFSKSKEALPIIKIVELKYGITNTTMYSNKKLDKKYKLENGDILFSWSGSPETSIDTFLWVNSTAWLNQHIFKVVTQLPEMRTYAYCLLKNLRPIFIDIAKNKQTTGLGHVTINDLKRLKTPINKNVIKTFSNKVTPVLNLLEKNLTEIEYLKKIRDSLLPKLMSGEVEVNTTEKELVNQ